MTQKIEGHARDIARLFNKTNKYSIAVLEESSAYSCKQKFDVFHSQFGTFYVRLKNITPNNSKYTVTIEIGSTLNFPVYDTEIIMHYSDKKLSKFECKECPSIDWQLKSSSETFTIDKLPPLSWQTVEIPTCASKLKELQRIELQIRNQKIYFNTNVPSLRVNTRHNPPLLPEEDE